MGPDTANSGSTAGWISLIGKGLLVALFHGSESVHGLHDHGDQVDHHIR